MPGDKQETSTGAKRCFVVMGFGIKTDFATGRKLDLDKSYRLLIRPAVEERGISCARADEIRHSGAIDVPMYHELLTADVVIADLSTANANALYELGVRHALRPWTTIVISENKLPYPFDLNHVLINAYTHLGDAIDYDEVVRFRKLLGETLDAVLKDRKPDSPVYTSLHDLMPPSLDRAVLEAVAEAGQPSLQRAGAAIATAGTAIARPDRGANDRTLAMLIDEGERAIAESRFVEAQASFSLAVRRCPGPGESSRFAAPAHADPYLIQRLALATYKAKQPDEISALNQALDLLSSNFNLAESNDPETVGLAGAIEKRLFDGGQGAEHLHRAIGFYSRGYYLRNDRYNGINLAYVLNVRMDSPLDATREEKIADFVWANRIRREVLLLCERERLEIRKREQRVATSAGPIAPDQEKRDREQKFWENRDREQKYWCLAVEAEARFGLGEFDAYEKTLAEIPATPHATWMFEAMEQQIGRLSKLLQKHGALVDPPWNWPKAAAP
jgi:hypothetical protein